MRWTAIMLALYSGTVFAYRDSHFGTQETPVPQNRRNDALTVTGRF